MLIFSNGVRKQFGVASWADTKCGRITGWYQPGAVMSWIQQNSQYGGGSGSTSSSGSSSSSYNQGSSSLLEVFFSRVLVRGFFTYELSSSTRSQKSHA